MPLVYARGEGGSEPRDDDRGGEARAYARKIRPEFARGDLVRVAGGRNQAEAELIRNLLIEEGVPSMLRRSAGFDVPDFLAAGPRDVMVPLSGAEHARGTLTYTELAEAEPAPARAGRGAPSAGHALRLAAAVLAGGALAATVAWAALAISG
ncbi:MAG: hypothetical protein H0V55_06240 [Thermoleophilaceae bacterium]|jgi:hypothetical protein|nr:hypothetical protein [Thermoleophilaceae bacterium]